MFEHLHVNFHLISTGTPSRGGLLLTYFYKSNTDLKMFNYLLLVTHPRNGMIRIGLKRDAKLQRGSDYACLSGHHTPRPRPSLNG